MFVNNFPQEIFVLHIHYTQNSGKIYNKKGVRKLKEDFQL